MRDPDCLSYLFLSSYGPEVGLASELLRAQGRLPCGFLSAHGAKQSVFEMTIDTADITPPNWRAQLPILSARQVTLREATASDLRPLIDLLSIADASRFGI